MFLALIDNSVRMLTYAALLLCCFYVESRRVLAKVENMRLTHFLRHSKSCDEKCVKSLIWWACLDSNQGPMDYESTALTN